jgi:sugar lactone lactonase YvrE
MTRALTLLDADLSFAEGPRWRDGQLWFSDMHGEAIYRIGFDGVRHTVLDLPGRSPSGLGFLPDGDLLFVSMTERTLVRFNGTTESVYADVSHLTGDELNDMVVTADGHAYVGSFPHERNGGVLIHVDPEGKSQVVATGMDFPNGTVITPDQKTLIVTESRARHHSAFTINADGSLSDRRIYATAPDGVGDGLALDAEGAIWSAQPLAHQFVRLLPGGEIVDRIAMGERMPIACALGGEDRRTMFLLSAMDVYAANIKGTRLSEIHHTRVVVPGAGTP